MAMTVVVVPDIGDFRDVPVIEILVSPGEVVAAEQPLVSLESDKATMDVPAPRAGVVGSINVAVGDLVSEGSTLLKLQVIDDARTPARRTGPAAPARTRRVDQRGTCRRRRRTAVHGAGTSGYPGRGGDRSAGRCGIKGRARGHDHPSAGHA